MPEKNKEQYMNDLHSMGVGLTKEIYVMKQMTGKTSKAFMRFFMIQMPKGGSHSIGEMPRIVDITWHTHQITEFPIRERDGVRWIHTHTTNDQDVVQLLSEKLFKNSWLRLERL